MTEPSLSASAGASRVRPTLPRWWLLGALTLVQTGMSGVQFSLIALLPVIKADLGVGVTRTVVLASAVNAGALVGALPAGQIIHRFGERRALAAGTTVAGCALIVAATLSNTWLMLVPLLLAGTGVVFSHPAGVRTIMRHFAAHERGAAISIRQTAVPLGGAVGALVLPTLAGSVGWRGALLCVGIAELALALLAWVALPANEGGPPLGQAIGGSPLAAWRVRGVARCVALCACLNVGQVAAVTFIGLYAHDALGYSVTAGAALLGLAQMAGIVGRIMWGVLSDRALGGRRGPLLAWIGAGATLSLLALAALSRGSPTALLVTVVACAGFTAVAWNGIGIALTTETAGLVNAATAMSLIVTVVAAVNTAVPVVGGRIIDTTGSYRTVWLASAALMAATPMLAYRARERHPPDR